MKFKKFADYLDGKETDASLIVRNDRYLSDVHAKLAGLVLRKNEFYDQAKVLLINPRMLDGLSCDFADSIRIAMASNNVESMKGCIGKHGDALDAKMRAYLESCIFNYESKVMGQMFTAHDVDLCVETLKGDCDLRIDKLAQHIRKCLRLAGMNHLEVDLEVNPSTALRAETVSATFGRIFPFTILFRLDDVLAESVSGDVSSLARHDHDRLMKHFGEKSVGINYFTGYLADDSGAKKFYEGKQKDMALGINTFMEKGSVLHENFPEGNFDVWRVKVKNPKMSMSDGRYKLIETAQLRWMHLIRRRRNEG